ncbi:hypothetical protein ACTWPB_06720 [Nocardia sp. IBHARD005]|uniref:hypothetical protein n=1 Tax=Nocardia sp. IBHARD005 TaxID=3457765 RepID=UPI004057DCDF
MAHTDPISTVQMEVLTWVAAGCSDGAMVGHSYKHSARALEWRRLLRVSTKGGIWHAELTDAGRHYLEHGQYPQGHWDSKRKARVRRPPVVRQDRPHRRLRADTDTPDQRNAGSVEHDPVPDTKNTNSFRSLSTTPATNGPRAAEEKRKPRPRPRPVDNFIAEIIEAGGTLLVQQTADSPNYHNLIRSALRFGKVPQGKLLVTGQVHETREQVIKLIDEPDPIIVPARRSLTHPAAIRLRDDEKSLLITPSVRVWALGLLDVLATALTARGGVVSAVPGHDPRGNYQRRNTAPEVLRVKIGRHAFGIQLVEPTEKVSHDATPTELARAARDSTYALAKYDVVPSGRVTLTILHGISCLESSWTYSDDEDVVDLARMVLELELRAADAEAKQLADESAAAERRRRWETARATAESAFADAYRGKVFREQAKRWRGLNELDEYLAAMRSHVAAIEDDHHRQDAARWLEWASNYSKELNPLHSELGMPTIPKPSADDLKPYLNGWSYYGPDHSSRW